MSNATLEARSEGRTSAKQRIAVVGLGLALAASLALSAYLVRASNEYFRQVGAVRLDPGGLKVYARAPTPEGPRPVLVFYGDSRALMWTPPAAVEPYAVVNRGIGNQTTAQILLRFDADVAKLKPSVVVFEGGVNDLKEIAEYPERRDEIVGDCKQNLQTIVTKLRAIGAKVIVVSVFDIGDLSLWRRPFWSSDVETAVREVNAWLPSIMVEGATLFDANAILDDGPQHVQRPYQVDFLHLTPAGYAALNTKLVPLVQALPETR